MVSPFPSWFGWSKSGTHMSSFLLWWQHQMKASCIVLSFTTAGQKHLKKNKCSTLIYQLCLVSPPVNFFAAHSGYNLSHEQRIHVEQVLQVAAGVEQCIALLFTIIYCSEPKRYWESWSRIKNSCNTSYSYSFTKLPKCYLWFQDCWADSRPRNPTAPLRSVWNLPPQELQECQGLQVQLALLLFACN